MNYNGKTYSEETFPKTFHAKKKVIKKKVLIRKEEK
jgi:hypothetical protein